MVTVSAIAWLEGRIVRMERVCARADLKKSAHYKRFLDILHFLYDLADHPDAEATLSREQCTAILRGVRDFSSRISSLDARSHKKIEAVAERRKMLLILGAFINECNRRGAEERQLEAAAE